MTHPLLQNCQGTRPDVLLDDVFPEGIEHLAVAAEDRSLVVATSAGTLNLIRFDGSRLQHARRWEGVSRIVWSDAGNLGAALLNGNQVVSFDRQLNRRWDLQITGLVTALAIAPHGSHLAVATDASRVHIVNSDRRQTARFETLRPLDFLSFLQHQPRLLGAAEYGHLCCHELDGTEVWNDRPASNTGGMSVTGDGRRILLAGYQHGVQLLNGRGQHKGSFMVDGTPCQVAASANRRRIAVRTLESRVYWLNFDGELLWAADLSQEPPAHMVIGPLGERLFLVTQSGRLLQLSW